MSGNHARVTRVDIHAEETGRYAEIRVEHSFYFLSPAALSFSELPAEIQSALLEWIEESS